MYLFTEQSFMSGLYLSTSCVSPLVPPIPLPFRHSFSCVPTGCRPHACLVPIGDRFSLSKSSQYHPKIPYVMLSPVSSKKYTIWGDVKLMVQDMSVLKFIFFLESSNIFSLPMNFSFVFMKTGSLWSFFTKMSIKYPSLNTHILSAVL